MLEDMEEQATNALFMDGKKLSLLRKGVRGGDGDVRRAIPRAIRSFL
jgi:hypothetical protein